jgi:lipoprotein NlpI
MTTHPPFNQAHRNEWLAFHYRDRPELDLPNKQELLRYYQKRGTRQDATTTTAANGESM